MINVETNIEYLQHSKRVISIYVLLSFLLLYLLILTPCELCCEGREGWMKDTRRKKHHDLLSWFQATTLGWGGRECDCICFCRTLWITYDIPSNMQADCVSVFQVHSHWLQIPGKENMPITQITTLNQSGPHADQYMFCREKSTYPTGLHADQRVNGFVYIREPSSHYFNCFYLLHCKCGTNSVTNNSKIDPKWQKSGQKAK